MIRRIAALGIGLAVCVSIPSAMRRIVAMQPAPKPLTQAERVCNGLEHWPHPIKEETPPGQVGTWKVPMAPPPDNATPEMVCGFGKDLYRPIPLGLR